ncbi:hypothetical protein HN51_046282 [Arachis hypogaea]
MAEAACLTLEPAAKNSGMSLLMKRMKMVVSNSAAQPDSSLANVADVSKEVQPKEETIQVTENKTHGDKGADENCSVGDNEEKKAQNGEEKMMEEATVYHGYQVRRSEPLKKLKQIALVSKELTNVKASIQAFEHSSDVQNDKKQRIALGENIMRLLLKLDTIQWKLNKGDAELLEENEKLRNMMDRLLDAGNEQLKVISDLTERVKDLEKRLAKSKKRMRTKRFKAASSVSKIISSKSNAGQHRAMDVAM